MQAVAGKLMEGIMEANYIISTIPPPSAHFEVMVNNSCCSSSSQEASSLSFTMRCQTKACRAVLAVVLGVLSNSGQANYDRCSPCQLLLFMGGTRKVGVGSMGSRSVRNDVIVMAAMLCYAMKKKKKEREREREKNSFSALCLWLLS